MLKSKAMGSSRRLSSGDGGGSALSNNKQKNRSSGKRSRLAGEVTIQPVTETDQTQPQTSSNLGPVAPSFEPASQNQNETSSTTSTPTTDTSTPPPTSSTDTTATPSVDRYKERLTKRETNIGTRIGRLNERSTRFGERLSAITGSTPEDEALRSRLTQRQENVEERVSKLTNRKENIAERLKTGDYGPNRYRMAGERMQKDAKLTAQDKINAYKFLTGADKYSDRRGVWSEISNAVETVKQTGKPYSEKDIARFMSSVRNR